MPTKWISAAPSPHGRQVVRREEDLEEAVKGSTCNKGLQTTSVQAQSTENIGQ